jgi:hypothetical protein
MKRRSGEGISMEPASIRYKNPGAMWPGTIATKWGSKRWIYLNDGTGQGGGGHGNKIAIFENWVDGICAQMDLWRMSPKYRNKKFKDAIAIWSGGNHVESYIAYVIARVPGMTRDTIMDDAFWQSPNGIKFLKAQAGHEAGKAIPAPEADWVEAQRRIFIGPVKAPVSTATKVGTGTASAVVVAGTVAVTVQQGWSWLEIGLSAFVAAGLVTAVVLLIKKARS